MVGIFREMNVGSVAVMAEKARDNGKRVFVAQLADAPKPHGMSTECPTIADMIEGIEGVGWQLDSFTGLNVSKSDRPVVIAVFRRVRRPVTRSTAGDAVSSAESVSVRYTA